MALMRAGAGADTGRMGLTVLDQAIAPVPNYVSYGSWVEQGSTHRPDGDTFRLRLDLGTFNGSLKLDPVVKIRLKGIDCWELSQPLGPAARDFAIAALTGAKQIVVATDKPVADSSLDRTVAQVWVDGQDLAEMLRAAGFEKTPTPTAQEYVKDVAGCARCGSEHLAVTFTRMRQPVPDPDGEFAWWAPCPSTGEPILLAVRPKSGA